MALLKPAIEWGELTVNGDTVSGSPVINDIDDTSEIEVGMVAYGASVTDGSVVVSKTADSFTLSDNATSTNEATQIRLYFRYDFEYPPTRDEGEQYRANQSVSKSLSGASQTITNYVEALRRLSFGFVSREDRDILRDDFYVPWALRGMSFRYYDDQDEASYVEYTNNSVDYVQKRQVKKHPDFLYEMDFSFRRVV